MIMIWEKWEHPKPEPNKLKILPIIPASTSQKFPIILTSLYLLAILYLFIQRNVQWTP